jgi:hypothetical protein
MEGNANLEVRVFPASFAELRADEDQGKMFISGYAAPYESLSEDLGGFREKIKRGAFARAIDTGMDIVCAPDHEYKAATILGRTTSGTLKLSHNDVGLRFRCQLPDTQAGRDIFQTTRRGDCRGMSFAFNVAPEKESWDQEGGLVVRTIDDLDVYDIAPVVHPAYHCTSVNVSRRALDQVAAIASRGRGTGHGGRRNHLQHLLELVKLHK